jgi:hypothetical protein
MSRRIAGLLVALALAAIGPIASPTAAAAGTKPTGCNARAASYFADNALLPFAERHYPSYYEDIAGEVDWSRAPLICRDLTGDGRAEMIVRLTCCTGGSLSPWAIFQRDDTGEWRMPYAQIRDTVFQLKIVRRSVRTMLPAPYEGACTSHVRYRVVRWTGARFRSHKTGRRRIHDPC